MEIMRKLAVMLLCVIQLVLSLSVAVYASDFPIDNLLPVEDAGAIIPSYTEVSEESEPPEEETSESETAVDAPETDSYADITDNMEVPEEEPVQINGATQVDSVTIWDGQKDGTVPIEIEYTEYYSKAFDVLDCINSVRAENGLYALEMDSALMEGAMIRAAENTVWWEHTRANGESFMTVCSIAQREILAWSYTTPAAAVSAWMSSAPHRSAILTSASSHIGIGCVNIDDVWFWVGLFSGKYYEVASPENYTDREVTNTVYMKPSYMDGLFTISLKGSTSAMYPGDTAQLKVKYYSDTYGYGFDVPVSGLTMYSTDLSVCKVDENGLITATGPGTASVVAFYPNYEAEAKVYAVTGLGSTTVSVTSPAALGTVTARIYPSTMSEDSIRADMLKTTSSSALYTGTAGSLGNEVPITFRGLPYGEYKLAVHAKGGFVILVDDLSVDAFYTTISYPMWLYGDVDYNGSVDSVDVLEIFNYSLGRPSILDSTPNIKQDAMRRLAADVNRDSAITIRDVTQILRRANGLASCFSTIP